MRRMPLIHRFTKLLPMLLTLGLAVPLSLQAQPRLAPIILQVPAELSNTHVIALLGRTKGLFQQEGIDLRIVVVKPSLAIPALLAGSTQFTTQFTTPFNAGLMGAKVKAILVIFDKPNFHLVAGPKVSSPQDLKGKVVSVFSLGTADHYIAKRAIDHLGLNPDKDVTFVALGGEKEQLAALRAGSVWAAMLKTPWDIRARQDGGKELLFTGDILEIPLNGLGTTDRMLQDNPALVKRMIRATLKSMATIRDQAAETADFISKTLKVDRAVAEAARLDLQRTMSFRGDASERALASLVDVGKVAGVIKGEAAIEKGVDFRLLREVQREKPGPS